MEEEESLPSVAGDAVKAERPAAHPAAALPELRERRGLAAALLNVARGRWKRVKDLVSATTRYVYQGQAAKGWGLGRHARACWPGGALAEHEHTRGHMMQMMILHRTQKAHGATQLRIRGLWLRRGGRGWGPNVHDKSTSMWLDHRAHAALASNPAAHSLLRYITACYTAIVRHRRAARLALLDKQDFQRENEQALGQVRTCWWPAAVHPAYVMLCRAGIS